MDHFLNQNLISFILIYISLGVMSLILIFSYPINFLNIMQKSLKILKIFSQDMKEKKKMTNDEQDQFVQEYENELNNNIKKDLSTPHSHEKQLFNIFSIVLGYPFIMLIICLAFLLNIFYLKTPID